MSSNNNNQAPFQLQTIIDSMLNPNENIHLRGNYKFRLETIKKEIEDAIRRYDREVMFTESNSKKSKGKAKAV